MQGTVAEHGNIVVIGAGIAGLSAAVAAAETARKNRVILIERAKASEAGGNTRWTSAYFRMDDVYDPGVNFVDDIVNFSGGRTSAQYVQRLTAALPETMEWIQGHGVRFRKAQTYFINSSRTRLQPVGGGEELLRRLTLAARDRNVDIRYECTVSALQVGPDGSVTGVSGESPEGAFEVSAAAVIIATGGFEGNSAMLAREVGATGTDLRPIAPGCAFNRGEGIEMALRVGARRGGEWQNFHAEPVDPRSSDPEALVMVFPYGILVNKDGDRFIDEAAGTVDETYESTARAIWRQQGNIAYFITDGHFSAVSASSRGLLTGVKPFQAQTLPELANALGIPAENLIATVGRYNAATAGNDQFDWREPDGVAARGVQPAKTNWAFPLSRPPFLSYPISCAIVFTFGGLDTDEHGRVLRQEGTSFPNLYAAGECTGIYFGKYPGGTSVMRGMVFGRLSGLSAASRAQDMQIRPA